MKNASEVPLRRRPAQRRSLKRVERMLDECALLLDEVGYDALTTKEVARRAGVPIGTFYQFFSDKQGLVRALGLRSARPSHSWRVRPSSERCRRSALTVWPMCTWGG